jgi:DNA replication licensing factor MCM3
VKLLNKEKEGPQITPEDIKKIQELSKRPDIFELLARSLAPSIFGHHYLKKAILLQLLGGLERNTSTGTHIRGYSCSFLSYCPHTVEVSNFVIDTF